MSFPAVKTQPGVGKNKNTSTGKGALLKSGGKGYFPEWRDSPIFPRNHPFAVHYYSAVKENIHRFTYSEGYFAVFYCFILLCPRIEKNLTPVGWGRAVKTTMRPRNLRPDLLICTLRFFEGSLNSNLKITSIIFSEILFLFSVGVPFFILLINFYVKILKKWTQI